LITPPLWVQGQDEQNLASALGFRVNRFNQNGSGSRGKADVAEVTLLHSNISALALFCDKRSGMIFAAGVVKAGKKVSQSGHPQQIRTRYGGICTHVHLLIPSLILFDFFFDVFLIIFETNIGQRPLISWQHGPHSSHHNVLSL
jgi:hypothetical protein